MDVLKFRLLCPRPVAELHDYLPRRPKGRFGYFALDEGCSFRICPRAIQVNLHIFDDPKRSTFRVFEMESQEDGSWYVF